ncbi:MAG: hypothetical protein FOGNACKC_06243 [Anaerolineae bacterium]|nr:hypothetical protein [Anaerolineae bacterium]
MSELDEIINNIKTGDLAAGRRSLMAYLRVHPDDATAWLWLSTVIDDPARQQECRVRALRLKPDIDHLAQSEQVADQESPELPELEDILGQPAGELPDVEDIAPVSSSPPKQSGRPAAPRRWKPTVATILLVGLVCCGLIIGGVWLQRGFQPCADLDVALGRPSGCQYVLETNEWVSSLAFSPDGQHFASGGAKNTVFLRRVSDGQVIRSMRMPGQRVGQVTGLAFSPSGDVVVAGGGDTSLRFWQVGNGNLYRSIESVHNWPLAVAFSPNWSFLVTGIKKQVALVRVQDGSYLRVFNGHTGEVNAVAFSPDGDTLASGGDDHTVRLWSASRGQQLQTLRGHTAPVQAVAFSPDGALLASGGGDNVVCLWQVAEGRQLRTLRGHSNSSAGMFDLLFTDTMAGVRDLAFSPDGTVLASAGSDGTVRLWRIADGKLLKTLKGHSNVVNKVVFSPDNRTLASGSGDSAIRLWRWR